MDQQSWEWIVAAILILLVILAVFIFPGKTKELFGEILGIGKEVFSNGEVKKEDSITAFENLISDIEKCANAADKAEICGCKVRVNFPETYYVKLDITSGKSRLGLYSENGRGAVRSRVFETVSFGKARADKGDYNDYMCSNLGQISKLFDDLDLVTDDNNVYVRPVYLDPTTLKNNPKKLYFCFITKDILRNDEAEDFYRTLPDCKSEIVPKTDNCNMYNGCPVKKCFRQDGYCYDCASQPVKNQCKYFKQGDCYNACSGIWGSPGWCEFDVLFDECRASQSKTFPDIPGISSPY